MHVCCGTDLGGSDNKLSMRTPRYLPDNQREHHAPYVEVKESPEIPSILARSLLHEVSHPAAQFLLAVVDRKERRGSLCGKQKWRKYTPVEPLTVAAATRRIRRWIRIAESLSKASSTPFFMLRHGKTLHAATGSTSTHRPVAPRVLRVAPALRRPTLLHLLLGQRSSPT